MTRVTPTLTLLAFNDDEILALAKVASSVQRSALVFASVVELDAFEGARATVCKAADDIVNASRSSRREQRPALEIVSNYYDNGHRIGAILVDPEIASMPTYAWSCARCPEHRYGAASTAIAAHGLINHSVACDG